MATKKQDIERAIKERRSQKTLSEVVEEADAKFSIKHLKSTQHFEDEGK